MSIQVPLPATLAASFILFHPLFADGSLEKTGGVSHRVKPTITEEDFHGFSSQSPHPNPRVLGWFSPRYHPARHPTWYPHILHSRMVSLAPFVHFAQSVFLLNNPS